VFLQAFELLQGNLVRFSSDAKSKNVPTAVLVHGILGSRRNLQSFARMIVEVGVRGTLQWVVVLGMKISSSTGRGCLLHCTSRVADGFDCTVHCRDFLLGRWCWWT